MPTTRPITPVPTVLQSTRIITMMESVNNTNSTPDLNSSHAFSHMDVAITLTTIMVFLFLVSATVLRYYVKHNIRINIPALIVQQLQYIANEYLLLNLNPNFNQITVHRLTNNRNPISDEISLDSFIQPIQIESTNENLHIDI
jgi:hypothetical protein